MMDENAFVRHYYTQSLDATQKIYAHNAHIANPIRQSGGTA